MKMVREIVDAMVLFEKNNVNPVVVTYSQGNLRVNRVMKSWKERRNLRECYIYLCQVEGRCDPVELRWEIESNRWFIERL
ncbi:hypothetical protein Q428_09780 [Fervidicella metallireducens AeB]|uniref:Uncharacterized protein n=1 Tax=Fervidicella metallireducens AeB TaxID=1403537 RepID=A0A017RUM4_9CLOT|nr:hypothetical protein [Fervidicella metallireducens]EYE88104.1 hypothetical protein Q428_09780 [Fervidicella metallireducens AeB]